MTNFQWKLNEFLSTGQIGPLKVTLTRYQISELIGEPEAWSIEDSQRNRAKVWKYGIVQLWFRGDILSYIGLYPETDVILPSNLSLAGYFPLESADLTAIERYLVEESLSYFIDLSYPTDCGFKLVVENKTDILFHENRFIHSMSHNLK